MCVCVIFANEGDTAPPAISVDHAPDLLDGPSITDDGKCVCVCLCVCVHVCVCVCVRACVCACSVCL